MNDETKQIYVDCCTVTSPYNIHGKLQAIISLFYQESVDGKIITRS